MNITMLVAITVATLSLPTMAMILALGLCKAAKTADSEQTTSRTFGLPLRH